MYREVTIQISDRYFDPAIFPFLSPFIAFTSIFMDFFTHFLDWSRIASVNAMVKHDQTPDLNLIQNG